MIDLQLITLIIGFAAMSWQYIYATPIVIFRLFIAKYIKNKFINELINCLTCSSFWIALFGFLYFSYSFPISFLSACFTSLLITHYDNTRKIKL